MLHLVTTERWNVNTEQMNSDLAQLAGYTWELSGYASKVPFANEGSLTMREVRNVFQLDPEPPQMELNDYICEAVRHKDLAYFSFFLHHFEKRLNSVIYRFLTRSGIDRYDPARFLDYTEQDEDGEETGEDVTRDDSWNYAEILWNGIQAKAVTAAFEQLSYKEQWYLEKRNAICMTCGRVSPLSTQSTFEDLAVDFEGTTASGADRFYRRTLDKLRLKLLESGVIHTVTLKHTECRKRNKKIAAAVCLYQADNDGKWGEIRFDFENGTAEIVRLADWDTVKSNIFANTAIRFVQGLPEARLLKSVVVPF